MYSSLNNITSTDILTGNIFPNGVWQKNIIYYMNEIVWKNKIVLDEFITYIAWAYLLKTHH